MRVARVWVDGRELAALEHQGRYFRVDRLDAVLGAPLPADVVDHAADFATRAFGLSLVGLDDHHEAIVEGTRLDDAQVLLPPGRLLPPCGRAPSVLELPSPGASALGGRLSGRSLCGHGSAALLPPGSGPALVAPALAFVVGDDLHLASVEEARRALLGRCLALAWSLESEEREAVAEGLGPFAGRELGTHLGPFLLASPGAGLSTPLEPSPDTVRLVIEGGEGPLALELEAPEARVARALSLASRFGDVVAGDVVIVASRKRLHVAAGRPVALRGEGLGELVGQAGFLPG